MFRFDNEMFNGAEGRDYFLEMEDQRNSAFCLFMSEAVLCGRF